ncbi:MAG: sigma-70 family RNA polymerase sigma factor [Acidimicrobiia bacterium]
MWVYPFVSRYSSVLHGTEPPLISSFESFYRSSRPRIFRAVALTLSDSDLALDATEEAMTRAAGRWSEVGGYENPSGWVYRVAVNWARTRLRRWSRESKGLDFEPGYEQRLPDPELVDAVMGLPLSYRTVIVARFFLDLSVAETAETLRIPQGTVKTRTFRALQRLRSVVEET